MKRLTLKLLAAATLAAMGAAYLVTAGVPAFFIPEKLHDPHALGATAVSQSAS